MLEANVPAKVVQEILGHADVTLTLNTYSHVVGTTAHEQIARINSLFAATEDKPSIQGRIAESRTQDKTEKPIEKTVPDKNKKHGEQEIS